MKTLMLVASLLCLSGCGPLTPGTVDDVERFHYLDVHVERPFACTGTVFLDLAPYVSAGMTRATYEFSLCRDDAAVQPAIEVTLPVSDTESVYRSVPSTSGHCPNGGVVAFMVETTLPQSTIRLASETAVSGTARIHLLSYRDR